MTEIVRNISNILTQLNVHTEYNGYTGNCANIAVAVYEIAVEELNNDRFRFALIDRPHHLGNGPDHILLEYETEYLDSKGVHTRSEILDSFDFSDQNGNQPVLQYETKQYITTLPYYTEETKDELKELIKSEIE